ncbi:MAG: penicillin acylase family protein [Bernardetiaceae bacterium]
MRKLPFLFILLLSVAVIWAGSRPWGVVPAMGPLLDPFGGFWQSLCPLSPPQPPGLNAPAEVVFDADYVPYIFAQNDEDLYFLQGYFTARDRLWQMEFQTHAAAGRLSEIIPDNADILNYDRQARRIGMTTAAHAALQSMQTDSLTRLALHAYARGVNAWIEQLSPQAYPLEYKILGYAPEAWTPLKSALLLKYMARDLSSGNRDLEYTNALLHLGKSVFERLYPPQTDFTAPIISRNDWSISQPIQLPDTLPMPYVEQAVRFPLIDSPPTLLGSNNWALDSSRTASGYATLCGDPHLGLSLPSLWYRVHLHAPSHRVGGVSLPGAPGIIIGFNDSIAWSPTNAAADLVDWHKITFDDHQRDRYLYEGEWRFTKKKIEAIHQKDAETRYDTVVYTHLGPVVYDRNFHPEVQDQHFAMRWLAHDSSNELRTFLRLNRAKNYRDYRDALVGYHCPAQNFAFASAQGDIALTIQGKFPIRYPDQGKFLLDGQTRQHTWQSFIPQAELPYVHNPPSGYVSSVNQYPTDSLYPYRFFSHGYERYRNRTLAAVLDTLTKATVSDLMALQSNNFGYKAYETVAFLLSCLSEEQQSDAWTKALQSWDFQYTPEAQAPVYFELWWEELRRLAWQETLPDSLAFYWPSDVVLLSLLRDTVPVPFWASAEDTSHTMTATRLIRQAFTQAHTQEIAPSWVAHKGTEIRHLARIPGLGAKDLQIGGYRSILNATSEHHGPSWRMIVELRPEGPRAWGVYPGGQSGNPASRFYTAFLSDWEKGQYRPIVWVNGPEALADPLYRYRFSP